MVGILDWEGSRISPLWDPRRLCSVIASPTDVDDPEEYAALKSLQKGILEDAQLYVSYSQLHLARLLHITDYGHSVQSKRAELDALFMQWFDGVCATGRGHHIASFMGLKDFIEVRWANFFRCRKLTDLSARRSSYSRSKQMSSTKFGCWRR